MWEIWTLGLRPYDKLGTPEIFSGIMSNSLRPEIPTDCLPAWSE